METEWKKRIQKPIGVSVWTVIVFIKFGIFDLFGILMGLREANGEFSLPFVVVLLTLTVFTAGAAIWAFIGENEGRIALLILLPVNILWIVLWAVSGLLDKEPSNDKIAVSVIIQQTILSLWVIAVEWYFMSKKVVEYYKQNVKS
jgi:Kef-type K+ transport system membrane component KefB